MIFAFVKPVYFQNCVITSKNMIFVNDIKRWISQSETFYADKVPHWTYINKQMKYLIEKFCVKIFMTVTKQKLKQIIIIFTF